MECDGMGWDVIWRWRRRPELLEASKQAYAGGERDTNKRGSVARDSRQAGTANRGADTADTAGAHALNG